MQNEPTHKYRFVLHKKYPYPCFIGLRCLAKSPIQKIGQWFLRLTLINSTHAVIDNTHSHNSKALEISLLIKPIVGLNRSAILRMINNPLRITTACGNSIRIKRPIFLNTVVPRFLIPFCYIYDIADWPAATSRLIDHFTVENHNRRLASVQIIGLLASQLIEQLRQRFQPHSC